jgi:hypothetical protein
VSMNTYSIRQATSADIAAIGALFDRAITWLAAHGVISQSRSGRVLLSDAKAG